MLKGQAAMEFLMTYGWALVVIVAVLAAIMATGILNPSLMASEECSISPDIQCPPAQLYLQGGNSHLTMELRNYLGYPIRVRSISVSSVDSEDVWEGNLAQTVLDQGETSQVDFDLTGFSPSKGGLVRLKINLEYYTCAYEVNPTCTANPEYLHTVTGRITTRVIG